MRAALPPDERRRQTDAVTARVLALDWTGPVLAFIGVRTEIDTGPLIAGLRKRGVDVAIPRITGDGRMEAAAWQEPLVDGAYGIPTSDGPVLEVTAVLVPGLAFDRDGGRMGYGGGYYDRWLAEHPHVHSIGLGFTEQLVDEVPREPHDHLLDRVICGEVP